MIARRLVWTAIALFGVSFFLPAYGDNSGFFCAKFCASMLEGGVSLGAIYYFAFTISNALMLSMPFLLIVKYRHDTVPRTLISIQLLAIAHVVSWWVVCIYDDIVVRVHIGYYVWLLSMILMLTAALIQRRRQSREADQVAFDPAEQSG